MQRKTLLILGGIFLGLAISAGAMLGRLSRPTQQAKLWAGDSASVRSVSVTGPQGKVELIKKGDDWWLSQPLSYPAQSTLVRSLISKVSGAALSDPLSDSPQKYSLFGLDAAGATKIELQGGSPFVFYAGKSAADYSSLYVRVGEQPSVYEASGISSYDVARGSADWMSRGIVSIPPASLQALLIRSTQTLSLDAGPGGAWRLGSKGPAISTGTGTALDGIENALKDLEADQVLLPPFAPLPKKPALELHVSWLDHGKPQESDLLAYAAKDSLMIVALGSEPRVRYQVYSWKLDAFRKPASAFR